MPDEVREEVESFYDRFTDTLLQNYINGNRRISCQSRFFMEAIPASASNILIIGCGAGEGARFLAEKVAPEAKIVASDISSENITIARTLFPHPRVTPLHADAIKEDIEGQYDAILFPDVYEHIPKDLRGQLHAQLKKLLTDNGRILFTVPSPGTQAELQERGEGLQVVDEVVTAEDFLQLARDVDGTLTHFAMKSVWRRNDYIHAMVEKNADTVAPLDAGQRIAVKSWPRLREYLFHRVCMLDEGPLRPITARIRRRRIERLKKKAAR